MPSFLELHRRGQPLLAPNPWDLGTARVLAELGFDALATTSVGLATTLGVLDGQVGRDAAVRHGGAIAEATGLPVTADLEDGYADDPAGVAETIRMARDSGLAGASIEDWDGERFHSIEAAAERVAAAVEAAGDDFVVTARADNYFHGVTDLEDTIARLQAYERAGAHVLYAPRLEQLTDFQELIAAVNAPVNVLLKPPDRTVAELSAAGAARITVGGNFAFAALGTLVELARQMLTEGKVGDGRLNATGMELAQVAFST